MKSIFDDINISCSVWDEAVVAQKRENAGWYYYHDSVVG